MVMIDNNTSQNINNGRLSDSNKKIKKFWEKIASFFKIIFVGNTLPQFFLHLYLIIILISSILLWRPFSRTSNVSINFIQALFIACSGFSNTGLTPIPINEYLSVWGKIILLFDMEIGCLGATVVFFCLWIFVRKKFDRNYKENPLILNLLQSERGGTKLSSTYKIVSISMILIICIQLFFTLIYSLIFFFFPAYNQILDPNTNISYNSSELLPQYHNFGLSLWIGLFTSVSAMGNAGFEIISNTSIAPYRNDWGTILQILLILELTIGGLGPVVIFDVFEKIRMRRKNLNYNITLFAKICFTTYFLISIITISLSFTSEILNTTSYIWTCDNSHHEFGYAVIYNKCMCLIYNVLDTRCLGMSSINCMALTETTKWIYTISMFIGGSPASTAGGIRTTTIAIIFITLFSKIRGYENITISHHKIEHETIKDALIVFFTAQIMIIIGVFVVWTSIPKNLQNNYPITDIVFEVMSAFGTVGLDLGITKTIQWWGLVYLILLMFIGQLGVLASITFSARKNPRYGDLDYPVETIKIA